MGEHDRSVRRSGQLVCDRRTGGGGAGIGVDSEAGQLDPMIVRDVHSDVIVVRSTGTEPGAAHPDGVVQIAAVGLDFLGHLGRGGRAGDAVCRASGDREWYVTRSVVFQPKQGIGREFSRQGWVRPDPPFHYAASKAALAQLTRCWALELGPEGIRVNAIAPGPIRTSLFRNAGMTEAQENELLDTRTATLPLRRAGTPEEAAIWIARLALEDNWTTGAIIPVDGGMSL